MIKKLVRGLLAVATLVTAPWGLAQTERFPSKPIQVVITSTPGSTSDVLTRFLGAEMSETLGQPIVVVSKASDTGTIGADFVRQQIANWERLVKVSGLQPQ